MHFSLVGVDFAFCAILLLHSPLFYPWLTNRLTAFFGLLSCYPILQSILTIYTYYSLIRAVFFYRRCVWFQSPYFVNPRYRRISLMCLPISRDCLAPPHGLESCLEHFILLVYFMSTLVGGSLQVHHLCFCDSCFCSVYSWFLFILYPVFLRFVCKSCIFCSFWSVGLFSFFLWLLPLYYSTLMSVCFDLYVKCNSDFSALTLVCVLANSDFGSSLYLTFWYSDPCLYFDSDSCLALNKSLFHFTPVCIWVLSLHLLFTFVT